MKLALTIVSWIAIVLGVLALIGAASASKPVYSLIGGGLFLTQGVLSLIYINQKEK